MLLSTFSNWMDHIAWKTQASNTVNTYIWYIVIIITNYFVWHSLQCKHEKIFWAFLQQTRLSQWAQAFFLFLQPRWAQNTRDLWSVVCKLANIIFLASCNILVHSESECRISVWSTGFLAMIFATSAIHV